MTQYHRADNLKKIFLSPAAPIFLFVLVVFTAYNVWEIFSRRADLEGDLKSINSKIETLEKEKAKLNKAISIIGSQEGIEYQAKARFNLKKTDENVVVVVPKEVKKEKTRKDLKFFWGKIREWVYSLRP